MREAISANMNKDAGKVVIYPAPSGAVLSTQYVVKVNGKPVAVYGARVASNSPNVQVQAYAKEIRFK